VSDRCEVRRGILQLGCVGLRVRGMTFLVEVKRVRGSGGLPVRLSGSHAVSGFLMMPQGARECLIVSHRVSGHLNVLGSLGS
jgi:hypothetical protein